MERVMGMESAPPGDDSSWVLDSSREDYVLKCQTTERHLQPFYLLDGTAIKIRSDNMTSVSLHKKTGRY